MIYEILITNHKNLINDIIETYFTNNIRDQIMTYFRIYFMFYILVNYVYNQELNNLLEIKKLFFDFLNNTIKTTQYTNIIKKNLNIHYDKLYKIFFTDNNIYFHVYFNNLIKYFLPLPYELNIYTPIITFRNNVNTFYKKNNIDYLEKINEFDLYKKYPFSYKINELDIHIPMTYFNSSNFKDLDIIYLIAKKDKLYITDSNNNILYSRINNINSIIIIF